jgi:hypothetical protein
MLKSKGMRIREPDKLFGTPDHSKSPGRYS